MYKKSGSSSLEKADRLLKSAGAKIAGPRKATVLDDDNDDVALDSYLKALKNEPKKKDYELDISGISDLSMEESEKITLQKPPASKFLKKKPQSGPIKIPASTTNVPSSSSKTPIGGSIKSYSAMSTLEKYSQKYGKSKTAGNKEKPKTITIDDSDLDMDISEDSQILRDMQKIKASRDATRERLQYTTQQSFAAKSGSVFADDSSSSSNEIGKGGSKFLKKKPTPIPMKTPEKKVIKTEIPTAKPEPKKKRSLFELESAKNHPSAVILDTDEESIAAYLNDLSSTKGHKYAKSASSSQAIDSIREEYSEAESINSNDSFKAKIVDLADLDYEEPEQDEWPGTRIEKTKTDRKSGIVHEVLKIQTVDDLEEIEEDIGSSPPLKGILTTPRTPRSKRHQRLSFTDVSHRSRSPSPEVILTARPDSVTEEIYTEEFDKSTTSIHTESEEEELTSIQTETRSKSKRDSIGGYSDDFTEATTPRRKYSSSSERSRTKSYTRSRSYSDDFSYTEDFSSDEESTIRSRRRYSRSSSFESYSSQASSTLSYSSLLTDRSSRSPSPRLTRRPSKTLKTKSVKVQTGEIPGLLYHWNNAPSNYNFLTGKSRVPTGTYHINPEKLDALTTHHPAEALINSLIKQQLVLAANMADLAKSRHRLLVENTQANYSYTTLAETKKYIASKRKKTLTYEEALKQVKEEMGLSVSPDNSECSKCQKRRKNSKSRNKQKDKQKKSRKVTKGDVIDKIHKEIDEQYHKNRADFSRIIQEKLEKSDPLEKSNSLNQLGTVSSEGFIMDKSDEVITQSRVIVHSNGDSKNGISVQKIDSVSEQMDSNKQGEKLNTASEPSLVTDTNYDDYDNTAKTEPEKKSTEEAEKILLKSTTKTDQEQNSDTNTEISDQESIRTTEQTTSSEEDKLKNVNFDLDLDDF